jgi:hypothetical protein
MVNMGLSRNGGGQYALIKKRIATLGIDISHYLPPRVEDLAGIRRGKRVAIEFVGTDELHRALWRVRCEGDFCDKSEEVMLSSSFLVISDTRSPVCRTCSYVRDLRGSRFVKLLVSKFIRIEKRGALWECRCDCGSIIEAFGNTLEAGHKTHCGCVDLHYRGGPTPKHGYARKKKSPEYTCLQRIIRRCRNPKDKHFSDYGKRGITVSDRWYTPAESLKIENFIADVGKRPHPDWSLDRIDPDGNYEPDNFRWAPSIVQDMNKRKYQPSQNLLDLAAKTEIRKILADPALSPETRAELRQKLLHGYYQRDAIGMQQADKWLTDNGIETERPIIGSNDPRSFRRANPALRVGVGRNAQRSTDRQDRVSN